MKKILALLLFIPALVYAQPQTCAVTGTFYNFDGSKADSIEVRIVQVFDSSGALIHSKPISYKTGGSMSGASRGVVAFNIVRNSVAYIYARAMNWDSYGSFGRPVAIPNTASGDLASFVTPDSVPSSSIVIMPIQTLVDSSGGSYATDSIRLGSGLRAIAPTNGGGTPTIIATATGAATDTTSLSYRIDQKVTQAQVSATLDSGALRTSPEIIPMTPITAPTHAEGRVFYDSATDALTVYNAESDVSLQVGEENWIYVRNNTGATITNGSAVYISGAIGQNPTIALAQASDTVKHCTIGIATHDIEINTNGYVTTSGLVRNLNLTDYGDGTEVYLSVDSAGIFTLDKPSFPNPIVRIGTVAYSHGTLGKLLVHIVHEPDTTGQNTASMLAAIRATDVTHTNQIAGKAGADSVQTALSGLLAKADTANNVRKTNPTIPGLKIAAAADTTKVLGTDASGNLVLRWDDAGGGAGADTTRYIPINGANKSTTGTLTTEGFALQNTGQKFVTYGPAPSAYYLAHDYLKSGTSFTIEGFSIKLATGSGSIDLASGGNVGIGATVPRMKLDVTGVFRSTDTIRSGNFTTYSYFIPGGALVSSSTQEIKRNISEIAAPSGIFAKFLSVKPRRYQFKPEAFRTLTLANVSDTLTKAERDAAIRADSLNAAKLAQRWQIGLLAEEFNQNIFGRASNEIDQAEVTTALWLVLRETIREAAALKNRIATLEAQAAAFETRLKALESK